MERSIVFRSVVLAAALALCGAGSAAAEVRTASLKDGADPEVTFDVEQIDVRLDSDAKRAEVKVRLHSGLPEPDAAPLNAAVLRVVLLSELQHNACPKYGGSSAAGETFLAISTDGAVPDGVRASVTINPSSKSADLPVTVSADRRELAVSITSDQYAQFTARCLRALASNDTGQADQSQAFDQMDPVPFAGAGQPPKPQTPPACADGRDNDGDRRVDLRDPGCLGDPAQAREDNPVLATPDCRDGRDNDGDGQQDVEDANCNGDPNAFSESAPLAVAPASPALTAAAQQHATGIVRKRLGARWSGARRRTAVCTPAPAAITCRFAGTLRRGKLRLTLVLRPNPDPMRIELMYELKGTAPANATACRRRATCSRKVAWIGEIVVPPWMLRPTGVARYE